MNSDFLKSFGDDPETKKQAEHIWKMLDDMSQNDPEGYQKFIQSNIKSGVEEMKAKKEKEDKQKKTQTQTKPQQAPQAPQVQFKPNVKEEESKQSAVEKNLNQVLNIKGETTKKKPLIEEIESKSFVKEPTFQINDNGNDLVVIIELPDVDKFADIDLLVSKQEISLEVPNTYKLLKGLPFKIDNNNPKAKWDKKNKRLTLTLKKI